MTLISETLSIVYEVVLNLLLFLFTCLTCNISRYYCLFKIRTKKEKEELQVEVEIENEKKLKKEEEMEKVEENEEINDSKDKEMVGEKQKVKNPRNEDDDTMFNEEIKNSDKH